MASTSSGAQYVLVFGVRARNDRRATYARIGGTLVFGAHTDILMKEHGLKPGDRFGECLHAPAP